MMISLQAKYKKLLMHDHVRASRMSFLRPRPKPKKAYPNSDRFGVDGRRLYSAHDAAKTAKATKAAKFAKAIEAAHAVEAAKGSKPIPRVKRQRRLLVIGGGSLAAALGLLIYLISAG